MRTGLGGARLPALRMRNGSGGSCRSSRQPAQGHSLRRLAQVWTLRCPSLQSMTRRSSLSLRRATGRGNAESMTGSEGTDEVIIRRQRSKDAGAADADEACLREVVAGVDGDREAAIGGAGGRGPDAPG